MGLDDDEANARPKKRRLASDAVGSLENVASNSPNETAPELTDAVMVPEESRPKLQLGYFGSDSSQHVKNSWVLCISHEFEDFSDHSRIGNKQDRDNIRETFTRRECVVKEILNAPKSKILNHFKSESVLLDLFKPADKGKEDREKPDVFILFLLTHGDSNGEVLTDHLVDPNNAYNEHFESYNISEIFEGLKKMSFCNDCHFILFFGPCRGPREEILFFPRIDFPGYDLASDEACRLLLQPNTKNFMIFYSTVESTLSKRTEEGTNMVLSLCKELNDLPENTPLEVLFTRVKSTMFLNLNNEGEIQTPELKLFPASRLTIYGNTGKTKPGLYYEWLTNDDGSPTRGRALFFGRQSQLKIDLQTAFSNLGLRPEDCNPMSIECTLNSTANQSFEMEQALVVCVMTKVCLGPPGSRGELCIKTADNNIIPIRNITNKFIGSRCRDLVDKPKLFFFLDFGLQADHVSYPLIAQSWGQRGGSNHSGIYIVVATAAAVVSDILDAVRSPLLQGDHSLQEMMARVIEKHQAQVRIMPQITSTMKWLLNFPPSINIEIYPNLKLTNVNVSRKKVKFNSKFFTPLLQKDSVSYVSGQSSCSQERVMSRIAQHLVTSFPNFLILKFCLAESKVLFQNLDILTLTVKDILKLLLRNSSQILDQLDKKIGENYVAIFLTGVKYLNSETVAFYQQMIRQISTLSVPLFISVDEKDLKVMKSYIVNKSENFVQIMPLNRSAVIQIFKTKLDWDTEKCSTVLESMALNNENCLLSDPSNHPIFYHLVKEENISKSLGTLFSFFEAFVRSVVKHQPITKNLVYGALIKYALKQYYTSVTILTKEENTLRNIPQFFTTGEHIQFHNNHLLDFLVTLSVIFKPTELDAWKSEIACKELLTELRFRPVRRFLDSFFERSVRDFDDEYVSIDSLKNKICNSADEKVLKVICEEGLFHLFKIAFKIKLTLEKDDWLKDSADTCLCLASFSNENLAISLINLGADLLPVLEKKKDHGLLHSVAARGDCLLMKRIIREMRDTKEMELSTGKLSQSQEENVDMGPVDKFIRDVLNARCNLGCAPLHLAAEHGRSEMVHLLITHGADVTLLDNWSNLWTPLHYAILNGHHKTTAAVLRAIEAKWGDSKVPMEGAIRLGLDLLLEKGSDAVARRRDEWMQTPKCSLHAYQDLLAFAVQHREQVVTDALKGRSMAFTAVEKRRLDVLKTLLDCKEQADVTDVENCTLLHVAAETGDVEVVRFLCGKSIDQQNNQKQSALEIAASKTILGVVEILLEQGAFASFSALCQAVLRTDRFCCERLIEAGAPFSSPSGRTVLHVAAEACSAVALQLMVELGADPGSADDNGQIPLHVAASKKDGLPCVELILKLGMDVNRPTTKGLTPLHLAVLHNISATAQVLLDNGAEPSLTDLKGRTVLYYAARSPQCLELLLGRKEVVIEKCTTEGLSVVQLAEHAGCMQSLDVLQRFFTASTSSKYQKLKLSVRAAKKRLAANHLEDRKILLRSSTRHALHEAVLKRNVDKVRLLLQEKGTNINANEWQEKQTALHLAVSSNCLSVVSVLVAAKNINVNARDANNETPLHIAARNGSAKIGKMLINYRANIEAANIWGQQPLHVSLEKGRSEFALMLLKCGVDLKASTSTGATALHVAAVKSEKAVLERLVQLGADIGARDGFERTPCQCAAAEGNLINVKYLLKLDKSALLLRDQIGNTLLHLAARGGFIDMAKLLVAKGVDHKSINNYNRIPLHVTHDDACAKFLKNLTD